MYLYTQKCYSPVMARRQQTYKDTATRKVLYKVDGIFQRALKEPALPQETVSCNDFQIDIDWHRQTTKLTYFSNFSKASRQSSLVMITQKMFLLMSVFQRCLRAKSMIFALTFINMETHCHGCISLQQLLCIEKHMKALINRISSELMD